MSSVGVSSVGVSATDGSAPVSRHWALFVDWCIAADRCFLPAAPDTVLAFLAELPAGPATVLRRVRAIDEAHRATGWPPPSTASAFDDLLRPARPPRFDPMAVGRALDVIPIGGWPIGMVGRRDAALVALVCSAGLTRRQVRALRSATGAHEQPCPPIFRTLTATERPGTCPACAVTRWTRIHATTVTEGWRTVRAELADLGETLARAETAHDCARPPVWTTAAGEHDTAPLFTPIDRHGVPETWPLSARSITTIIATRLADSSRSWEGGRDDSDSTASPRGRTWDETDRARVLAERKAAALRYADIEASIDEADAYAEAILERLDAALNGELTSSRNPL